LGVIPPVNQGDLIALRTQKGVHELIPGLTGWAQINRRDELPIPQKTDLDVEYLHHQSLWLDIKIIWLTFIKAIKKDEVYH
jgi:O-antigen biosynthesis protein WbqP